jgi:hypothetical protein
MMAFIDAFTVKARRNTYGSYQSLQWGYFTGAIKNLFCMVKMMYFRGTGMIFPRLALL